MNPHRMFNDLVDMFGPTLRSRNLSLVLDLPTVENLVR
jgi:hypothetical protein